MKQLLVALVILVGSLLAMPGWAQPPEPEPDYYIVDLDIVYDSGIVETFTVGSWNHFETYNDIYTVPDDAALEGIMWKAALTNHLNTPCIRSALQVYGAFGNVSSGGFFSCFSSAGNPTHEFCISRTTGGGFGTAPYCDSLGTFDANHQRAVDILQDTGSIDFQLHFEQNSGAHRLGQIVVYDVWLVLYGIPPTDASFDADPSGGPAPLVVNFTDTSSGPVTTWNWYVDDILFSTQINPTYIFNEPGSYEIRLVVNEGQVNESEESDTIIVTEPESLIRPFTFADEGVPSGGIDIPDAPIVTGYSFVDFPTFEEGQNSAIAFSQDRATVYAARSGTIASIRPIRNANCDSSSDSCYVVFSHDTGNAFKEFVFMLSDVYIVTIETAPSRYLNYLVTNPTVYTQIGAAISEGCPLGESVPIVNQFTTVGQVAKNILEFIEALWGLFLDPTAIDEIISVLSPAQLPNSTHFTVVQDVVIVGGDSFLLPIIQSLVAYTEDEPRSCEYQPSACLNTDPELKRPELWNSIGLTEFFSGGGVVLNPGASIDMQLTLDSEADYTVEVWARSMQEAPGQVAAQIGQTFTTFTINGQNYQQLVIPSGTHTPDVGLYYTLAVSNQGTTPVFIQSICARDENEGSARPATCYFDNPSFDGLPAAQGWDVSGSVNDGIIPGEIVMRDGDTISQNAQLYPDGVEAHIYFVTVTATVGGATIETLRADSASDVGFEYEYPVGAGFEALFGPNSADMYPVSGFFTGVDNGITFLPDNQIVFYANVTVSSFENSDFTFRAVIDSANPDLFVRVREVCIDDPFDHHDEPDAWIPEPPFGPNCVGISPPQGNDIGPWIFYHWSQLERFFQCDLLILLNRMHDTAQRTYNLIGWQFRYWQSTLLMATNWLSSDLVYWLNGHFRNMAVGQVTTIENAPSASLWDVLLALVNLVIGPLIGMLNQILTVILGIVGQAVTLLFSIIDDVISLVLAMLIQAVNLFNLGQTLLKVIIDAYNNATPTPLPGMADCSANPQANAWCIAMWVLSNTIFSGTGAAIIPVVTGILSIHLILWVIGELKRAVMQVGQSS